MFISSTYISCVKDEFDAPPTGCEDPALDANISIKKLKEDYYISGAATQITSDLIINGVVVADDRSGNLYKTMVIQDETAGIAVRLDMSDYYTRFPVGRRVFIKLKGLYIGAYNNLIQIGANDPADPANVATIPLSLVEQFIIKGECNLNVTPIDVSIDNLSPDTHQNMLIRLSNVEFQVSDTNKTYADVAAQLSLNRTVKDCNGNSIIVRTSNFANFASANTPSGNGTLTAIYTVFGTTPQLVLRDLSDVNMEGPRCGSQPGGPVVTIMSIRNLYTGTTTTVPANKKIKGVVISDKDNGNIDVKNIILQDSTGGIVVRFTANNSFSLNAEVEVDISGQELSTFNGQLQVNNVPIANAVQTGTGSVTPKVATIAQINANFSAWESTLVKVFDATITGSGTTYNGSKTLNDGTATITLYTRLQASFANVNHPTTPVDITGILIPFNTTKQISLRNLSDVQ